MSWARVLNEAQVRALGCLKSVSTTEQSTSRLSGVNLSTMKSLARLGLIEFYAYVAETGHVTRERALSFECATPNERTRVTPAGFRAWADIVESRRS